MGAAGLIKHPFHTVIKPFQTIPSNSLTKPQTLKSIELFAIYDKSVELLHLKD
jgi:hypothetical protein